MPRQIPPRQEIAAFLKELRECPKIYVKDERSDKKNEQTLFALGITSEHREEIIRNLQYTNYYRGPSPEHKKVFSKDMVWEFGKRVKGKEIYIKVKVFKLRSGKKIGKCLSFKPAERPIAYPYKTRR